MGSEKKPTPTDSTQKLLQAPTEAIRYFGDDDAAHPFVNSPLAEGRPPPVRLALSRSISWAQSP